MNKAIAFRAAAHVQDFLPMAKRDILKFEGCTQAWQRALAQAGIALGDLSFVETHDCFTIAELIEYEAMGLVPEGQGARAIKEGWTQKDGRLPVNPSGGLKAKGHPIGATGVSMHALCGDAAHRHGRRHPGEGRAARRHLQHGRRRGRELREHAGADQIGARRPRARASSAMRFVCGAIRLFLFGHVLGLLVPDDRRRNLGFLVLFLLRAVAASARSAAASCAGLPRRAGAAANP